MLWPMRSVRRFPRLLASMVKIRTLTPFLLSGVFSGFKISSIPASHLHPITDVANPVTDFAAAGYDLLLAIGIEVESRNAEEVGKDLAELPEVFSVNLTTGSNDLEILVGARSFEELSYFLHKEVANIAGIGRMYPGLTIDVLKYQSEIVPNL